MAEHGAYMVNSVVKCFAIVEALASQGASSLSSLKAALGLDKATLHRILSTLKALGYVKQNQSDQRYFLTLKMFQTGNMVVERGGLKSIIRPYLEKISNDFQEPLYAAVLIEPGQAVCIDKSEAEDDLQSFSPEISIGDSVIFHATAMGKCFLAFINPEDLPLSMSGLSYERFTPSTIVDPAMLERDLEKIRHDGYALEEGERHAGVMCIAVPVLNSQGRAQAAISVTGYAVRLMVKKEGLIRSLKDASRELSVICGLEPEKWPIA
ncbi:MAG: IclR family transcriptional regulator [Candidatus Adiutrix sp.]|jgi:IclR family acetate operon transcriptional repressor|nr:IclR family transcriptional regulator [Candidatus Adiutrix sp.]